MQVKITIAQEEDGGYVVCCPALGCFTQGDTYEEAMANIREAIECYLESLEDEVQPSDFDVPADAKVVEIVV